MSELTKSYQRLYVTRVSGIGLFTFFLLSIMAVLGNAINLITERIEVMIIGSILIFFFLCVIIDQLKARKFQFWALGAIVSFFGILIFFSPIVLYGLMLEEITFLSLPVWGISIILGLLLILFGYTVDAYDLNKKVAVKLSEIGTLITNYKWKSVPKKVGILIITIMGGFISYLIKGFRRFRTHLMKARNSLFNFIHLSFTRIINFLKKIPGLLSNTLKLFFEFSYLTLPLSILIFLVINLEHTLPDLLSVIIIIILLFIIGVAFQKGEQIGIFVNQLTDYSWQTIVHVNTKIHSIKERLGRYRCPNCNQSISSLEVCPNCETKVESCLICKLPIQKAQTVTVCTSCLHKSHKSHWETYVVRMGNPCPACKN